VVCFDIDADTRVSCTILGHVHNCAVGVINDGMARSRLGCATNGDVR
jgi:hypothetical protein